MKIYTNTVCFHEKMWFVSKRWISQRVATSKTKITLVATMGLLGFQILPLCQNSSKLPLRTPKFGHEKHGRRRVNRSQERGIPPEIHVLVGASRGMV